MAGVDFALILHLHQPIYLDPECPDPGEAILPWVRLHAARAYYDLARVLWEHPGARVHLNVTPCLLDQLEGYVRGDFSDRFYALSVRPAGDLSGPEREFVWANFFMVDWQRELQQMPRYRELLTRRGEDLARVDLHRLAKESRDDELRDLQLLFNLAWTGFSLRAEDPALRDLLEKGRGFSESDKSAVLQSHARAAERIIPLWRALEARGQVELTTSPHYHPILPLLIDSDAASEGLPGVALPKRFAYPEDARLQVQQARLTHAERFGQPPRGMWPAEGAVSTQAAEIFRAEGTAWIASDEGVLFRSLPVEKGVAPDRAALYEAYGLRTAAGDLDVVFRDRALSDLIGFQYARLEAEAAVADLASHLTTIGRARDGKGDRPLVTLILDGENPWEHYPEGGRDFLHRLFALLEKGDPAQSVLLGEALPKRKKRPLPKLFPGSWVDANFRIWIGHPDHHQRPWEALSTVRHALSQARAAGFSPARCDEAQHHLLVAEGSDWFWWYSSEFATETAAEFDQLFRARVRTASAALGIDPPAEVERALSPLAKLRAPLPVAVHMPEALLAPKVDGRVTRYGEWSKAGHLLADPARGAMFQGNVVFLALRFGFDAESLYLRLDPKDPELFLGDGAELLTEVHLSSDSRAATVALSGQPDRLEPVRSASGAEELGESCAHSILEARIALSKLGVQVGQRVSLWIAVKRKGVMLQRLPASGALELSVPGADFERAHWKV
jgi:alpha-amylase/alpha-mannosidase (GH57 family)